MFLTFWLNRFWQRIDRLRALVRRFVWFRFDRWFRLHDGDARAGMLCIWFVPIPLLFFAPNLFGFTTCLLQPLLLAPACGQLFIFLCFTLIPCFLQSTLYRSNKMFRISIETNVANLQSVSANQWFQVLWKFASFGHYRAFDEYGHQTNTAL